VEEQIFTVKKGDSLKSIAENLVKQKLLLDAESFNLYARLNNLDKQIKTGRFPLSPNLNTQQTGRLNNSRDRSDFKQFKSNQSWRIHQNYQGFSELCKISLLEYHQTKSPSTSVGRLSFSRYLLCQRLGIFH
jgi:cell division protein YceG involved in septum cleavage